MVSLRLPRLKATPRRANGCAAGNFPGTLKQAKKKGRTGRPFDCVRAVSAPMPLGAHRLGGRTELAQQADFAGLEHPQALLALTDFLDAPANLPREAVESQARARASQMVVKHPPVAHRELQ